MELVVNTLTCLPKHSIITIMSECKEYNNGSVLAWWEHGSLHRLDGPAIIVSDGRPDQWWVDGYRMESYREFQNSTGCSDEDIILLKIKWGEMRSWYA